MTTKKDKTRIALCQLLEDEAEAAADAARADPEMLRRGAELAAATRKLVPAMPSAPNYAVGTDGARERDRAVVGARLHMIRHLETTAGEVGGPRLPPHHEMVAMPDDEFRAMVARVEDLVRNASKPPGR